MSRTTSGPKLIADMLAANQAGNRELQREYQRQLYEQFGVRLMFGDELLAQQGGADK